MALKPTVFVVDDEPAMCRSLERLLTAEGYRVATFASAADFLDHCDPGLPGCLVLDMRMEVMDGLQLQAELIRRDFHIPIIMISGFAEVPNVVQAVRAGAVDFLEKPFKDEQLLQRVRQAIEQDARHRAEEKERAEIEARLSRLTPREQEVARLLAAGETTKQIALRLGISPKTADNHRSAVLRKTEVDSVVQLVQLLQKMDR